MELRELRRRLYYELPAEESICFNDTEIARHRYELTVRRGSTVHHIRIRPSYRKACDAVMALFETNATDNQSAYIGVYYDARRKKHPYQSRASIGRSHMVALGTYATAEEAARAYDAYVIHHRLDLPLNFPERAQVAS